MNREQQLEQNLILLIQSIREHYKGNEQDLDVISDDIVATLNLAIPETQWFLNYYCCDHEGTEHEVEAGDGTCWEDEWSCMCNDRCPVCNRETEPYKSEEIA